MKDEKQLQTFILSIEEYIFILLLCSIDFPIVKSELIITIS